MDLVGGNIHSVHIPCARRYIPSTSEKNASQEDIVHGVARDTCRLGVVYSLSASAEGPFSLESLTLEST